MKNVTKIVGALIAVATALATVPAINQGVAAFLMAHSEIGVIIAGVGSLVALFHTPSAS